MKKLIFLILCAITFASLEAAAQAPSFSALYVDISVERQEIIAGPYARYAQKYLGTSAPLVDKVLLEIKRVNILDNNDIEPQNNASTKEDDFPKLPVDRTSSATLGAEESARQAAARIFEIRRSRFELITGNAGENVFGAGLTSALAELDRLEQEYLALFLGKTTRQITTQRFRVMPLRGIHSYALCRFSTTAGLLTADDDSGEPVMLELKNLGAPSLQGLGATDKPSSKSTSYMVPAEVQCSVVWQNERLASEVLPISQLGTQVFINQ